MQTEYSSNTTLDLGGSDVTRPDAASVGRDDPEQDSRATKGRKKREQREYRGQMLNRWPRAFARIFDLMWEMPLALLVLMLLASKSGSTVQNMGTAEIVFFLFLSLPLALLLDGLIAGIFSNTPAKALIGVKATSSRGERLNLVTHLRRNFGVWTDGLALGIVPISVFSMLRQFKRVSGRREAIYDERLHVRVRSGSLTAVRVLIPPVLLIAGFAALLVWVVDHSF